MSLFVFALFSGTLCSTATLLSPGTTIQDDFGVYDSKSGNGWINGDIILQSIISSQKYHGLFDGDLNGNISDNNTFNGISELLRTDIQLNVAKNGKLIMNFTLVFSCDILNKSDIIEVSIGNTISKQYYWIDTYDDLYSTNKYPFKTSTFTIDLDDSDPILYEECEHIPGNMGVWTISDSIASSITDANTQIPISFKSAFDYDTMAEDEEKYWAVYNIEFTVIDTSGSPNNNNDDDDIDLVMIISIAVSGLFLLIAIIFIIWYCKRKRNDESDQVEMTEDESDKVQMIDGVQWRYTVKGQKITDKTQLKSAFDTPMGMINQEMIGIQTVNNR